MPFLEKSNWVVLFVAVATLMIYAAMIVPPALRMPVSEVHWVEPTLWSIAGFVVANILGNVVVAATCPEEYDKKDQRDREIDHFGERVGNWALIAGSLVALALAMVDADHFWIGIAIYFGGIVAAIVSSTTKIAAYHGPFQRW